MTDLLITYPAGSTSESATVLAVQRTGTDVLFAVDRTPCHPESPRWPDQPADRCTLEAHTPQETHTPPELHPLQETHSHQEAHSHLEAHTLPDAHTPLECLEGYLLGEQLGLNDPPEGAREAIRCVVHRLPHKTSIEVGEQVRLSVDEHYREALSRSHTRCHLVSLALNAALAESWRKDPPARDSLGNPDFDKLAIVSSRISEHGSLDIYRVGKHLRKSGFSADSLSDTEALANAVARIAEGWLLSSPESIVTPGRCRLEERRTWTCELPVGTASFPCGGTHSRRVEPAEGVTVTISWDPQERRLAMTAGSCHIVEQSVYD